MTTPQAPAAVRTLLDVLDVLVVAMVEESARVGLDRPIPTARADAEEILVLIPPADRESLEVGILLAEVERRARDGILSVSRHEAGDVGPWFANITNGSWPDTGYPFTDGTTLHAALTALLAQLPAADAP